MDNIPRGGHLIGVAKRRPYEFQLEGSFHPISLVVQGIGDLPTRVDVEVGLRNAYGRL